MRIPFHLRADSIRHSTQRACALADASLLVTLASAPPAMIVLTTLDRMLWAEILLLTITEALVQLREHECDWRGPMGLTPHRPRSSALISTLKALEKIETVLETVLICVFAVVDTMETLSLVTFMAPATMAMIRVESVHNV